jgi:hypothetical protein
MSILRLRKYTADAEILGSPHLVEFDGERKTLTIHDLDAVLAAQGLERLALGELVGVEQDAEAMARRQAETEARTERVDEAPQPEPSAAPSRRPKIVLVPAQSSVEPAPAVPAAPVPVPIASSPVVPPPVEPAPVAAVVSAAPATAVTGQQVTLAAAKVAPPVPDKASAEAPLPPALTEAKQLREVLTCLEMAGHTTEDAMVTECARLKARVPLLSRITNLETRVRRTYQTMFGTGGVSA